MEHQLEVETLTFALLGDLSLAQVERHMIEAALQRAGGKQTEAARLLGISRFALRNRLKKYQLFHLSRLSSSHQFPLLAPPKGERIMRRGIMPEGER